MLSLIILMLRWCSSKLAANQIRQYISNRIDESYSEKLTVDAFWVSD